MTNEGGQRSFGPELTPLILNVGDCPTHADSISFGQGSHLIAGLEIDGDTCVFGVGTEWEGVGGGEIQSECRADRALGTIEITGISFGDGTNFAAIGEYCEPITPRQISQ